jgi:hypothetical protein
MLPTTQHQLNVSTSSSDDDGLPPAFEDVYTFNFNGAHGEDLAEIVALYRHFIAAGLDPRTGSPLQTKLRFAPPPASLFPPSPSRIFESSSSTCTWQGASVPAELNAGGRGGGSVCSDTVLCTNRRGRHDDDNVILTGMMLLTNSFSEAHLNDDSTMHSFAEDSIYLTRKRNKKREHQSRLD